ncbi:MAG TPA: hypothetical protein VGB37_16450 [Candidatus Lokiarchaeia archaeon]
MTCENFSKCFGKDWIMAWFGLLIIVIIIMLGKKWFGEEEITGYSYNWFFSMIGAIIYFLVLSFSGSAKLSLVIGIASCLIAGFVAGAFFGGAD